MKLQFAKAMKEWVLQLEPGQLVCTPHELPKKKLLGWTVRRVARCMGHWHRISADGRRLQCRGVTTWNSGPGPAAGTTVRGPMEQAIIGTRVADPSNPVELVRIVRSMDPCYGCAIHVMTPNGKTLSQFAVS